MPTDTRTVAHKETGIHSLLSLPSVYAGFQNLIGATNLWREFVRQLNVQPGQRLLDIGCGPGNILEFLPNDVDYVGIDLNPMYIAQARENYGQQGRFVCREFNSDFSLDEGKFDRVMAIGLLHHLDDQAAGHLFKAARSVLNPGGRLLTIDPCFTEQQSSFARFLVKQDRGQAVRTAEAYEALARPHFEQVQLHIRNNLIRIPYTHIMIECTAD